MKFASPDTGWKGRFSMATPWTMPHRPLVTAAAVLLPDHPSAHFRYPFTIQNMMHVVFFIGLGELFVRWRIGTREEAFLRKKVSAGGRPNRAHRQRTRADPQARGEQVRPRPRHPALADQSRDPAVPVVELRRASRERDEPAPRAHRAPPGHAPRAGAFHRASRRDAACRRNAAAGAVGQAQGHRNPPPILPGRIHDHRPQPLSAAERRRHQSMPQTFRRGLFAPATCSLAMRGAGDLTLVNGDDSTATCWCPDSDLCDTH